MDLGLTEQEISELSLHGICLLLNRNRELQRIDAALHGVELKDSEAYATDDQLADFFGRMSK